MIRVTRPVAIEAGQSPRRKNRLKRIAPMHRNDKTLAAIRITFFAGIRNDPTYSHYSAGGGFGVCSITSRRPTCHMRYDLPVFEIDMCTVNRWVGILEEIKCARLVVTNLISPFFHFTMAKTISKVNVSKLKFGGLR
jgi:hypothetical protein